MKKKIQISKIKSCLKIIKRLTNTSLNNLNIHITTNKIDAARKCLPTKTSLELDGLTVNSYQTFKEKPTSVLLKLFYKIENEGALQSSASKGKEYPNSKSV